MNTPPRDPKELNPELDDDLCKILLKAIEREPAGRFSSAAAFKDALDNLGRDSF